MNKSKLDNDLIEYEDVQIIKNNIHVPIIVKISTKTKLIRNSSCVYSYIGSREIKKWFESREIYTE